MRPEPAHRSDRDRDEAEDLRNAAKAAQSVSVIVPVTFTLLWIGALVVESDAIVFVYLFLIALFPPAVAFCVASFAAWLGRAATDAKPATAHRMRLAGVVLAVLALWLVVLEALCLGVVLLTTWSTGP